MYFSHNLYNCRIDLINFVLLNGLLTLFNMFCFLAVYLGRWRVFKHCHIPDEDVWENCHLWGHLSVQPHWSTFPRYCAPACRRTGQIHRHGDGTGWLSCLHVLDGVWQCSLKEKEAWLLPPSGHTRSLIGLFHFSCALHLSLPHFSILKSLPPSPLYSQGSKRSVS